MWWQSIIAGANHLHRPCRPGCRATAAHRPGRASRPGASSALVAVSLLTKSTELAALDSSSSWPPRYHGQHLQIRLSLRRCWSSRLVLLLSLPLSRTASCSCVGASLSMRCFLAILRGTHVRSLLFSITVAFGNCRWAACRWHVGRLFDLIAVALTVADGRGRCWAARSLSWSWSWSCGPAPSSSSAGCGSGCMEGHGDLASTQQRGRVR